MLTQPGTEADPARYLHFSSWLLGASPQTQLPFRLQREGDSRSTQEMTKTQEAEAEVGLLEAGSNQGPVGTRNRLLKSHLSI